jgi:hypothetical protein
MRFPAWRDQRAAVIDGDGNVNLLVGLKFGVKCQSQQAAFAFHIDLAREVQERVGFKRAGGKMKHIDPTFARPHE